MTLLAVLVLAIPALARELYWDDGLDEGTIMHRMAGVLNHDYEGEGPGDTDGELGMVSGFTVWWQWDWSRNDKVSLRTVGSWGQPDQIIYTTGFDEDYSYENIGGHWWRITFDEPVEVPGEFFGVVSSYYDSDINICYDGAQEWDSPHSWYYGWQELTYGDFRIRVEWEAGASYPYVYGMDPDDGEADVWRGSEIVFHCKDDHSKIDRSTVSFTAYDSSLGNSRAAGLDSETNGIIPGQFYFSDISDPKDVLCTFDPDGPLPVDRITCIVDGKLADEWGTEMGLDFIWSFTTEGYQSVEEASWGQIKATF